MWPIQLISTFLLFRSHYITITQNSIKWRIYESLPEDVGGFLVFFLLFSFLFFDGDGDFSDSELSVEDEDFVLLEEVEDVLEEVPDDDSLSLDSLKIIFMLNISTLDFYWHHDFPSK